MPPGCQGLGEAGTVSWEPRPGATAPASQSTLVKVAPSIGTPKPPAGGIPECPHLPGRGELAWWPWLVTKAVQTRGCHSASSERQPLQTLGCKRELSLSPLILDIAPLGPITVQGTLDLHPQGRDGLLCQAGPHPA